jgi:tRNA nucleotidyltransferase/poly(A) polymerase
MPTFFDEVIATLRTLPGRAYITGGAVRDLLGIKDGEEH